MMHVGNAQTREGGGDARLPRDSRKTEGALNSCGFTIAAEVRKDIISSSACVTALPSDESLGTNSINGTGCITRRTVWPLTHRIINDICNGVVSGATIIILVATVWTSDGQAAGETTRGRYDQNELPWRVPAPLVYIVVEPGRRRASTPGSRCPQRISGCSDLGSGSNCR